MIRLFGVFLCLLLLGCGAGESPAADAPAEQTLFQALDSSRTGINFVNSVRNTDAFNIFSYRNFYNGGGVGIGDLNNDGLPDIYLTANQGPNKLYLNRGNWEYQDVSATAGVELPGQWSTGVTLVDVNADGWLDIYVCNAGFQEGVNQNNSLFINQRDGTFREEATDYGLDDAGYSTHAAFFDYDLDGDLDVYLLNNSFIPVNTLNFSNQRERYAADWNVKPFLRGGGDRLMRNEGGRFVDVSAEAGIYGSLIGFGLGVTVGDVNGDDYPDLYISNDFFERDYLYINQQDGTFREEVEEYMRHMSLASMGADLADINNDGFPEIFTTEMLPETDFRRKTTVQFENLTNYLLKQQRGFYHQYMQNALQLNNGDGSFSEIAQYAGVSATDWSWGALLFDADLDGYRDIFVSNGIYHNLTSQDFIDFFADDIVRKMALTGKKEEVENIIEKMPSEPLPNKLFRNRGDLSFEDVSEAYGLGAATFSNGAAYGDLDGDGDLDLIVSNVNQPVSVYENHARDMTDDRSLTLRLVGKIGSNPFAVGATATVFQEDQLKTSTVMPSRGFQSSVDYPLVFGLGETASVDSIRIVWTDRSVTTLNGPVAADTVMIVAYDKVARRRPLPSGETASDLRPSMTLVEPVELGLAPHREDDYQDLLQEGMVIRSLSREGPTALAGDVDGDGDEDLFIGGARNQAGQLYLQENGKLVASDQAAFQQVSQTEDIGGAFFDADADGDLDLYVGSGGNLTTNNNFLLSDKLYFNDGTGKFSLRSGAIPPVGLNTSVVVPLDFDGDGDVDLFVGTRSVPGNYGAPAPSFLLENNGGGRFRDITRQAAPQFATLGMVTDAVLESTGASTPPRLTVVSEWGTPRQFHFPGGTLEEISSNLSDYSGWWYAVEAADLDGDGDSDLILGNRGENFYFSASADRPAKLFVADFDQNGTTDKIITQQIDGKDMPLAMKREMTAQLASLRKKNLKHEDYARQSINGLFPPEVLSRARVLEAVYFSSAVAFREADGSYRVEALPDRVQLSSVNAILARDLNGDGSMDIVLGGNQSGFLPQFARLDASYGQILLNRGDGSFTEPDVATSGLHLRGEIKSILSFQLGKNAMFIATVNNASPEAFQLLLPHESQE